MLRCSSLCLRSTRSLHTSVAARGVEEFFEESTAANKDGVVVTGRSWRSSELRLKSFDELHALWYVLLKERNKLLTDRAGRATVRGWSGAGRLRKVKESMSRLKTVLRERQIVYEDTKRRLLERQKLYFQQQRDAVQAKQ